MAKKRRIIQQQEEEEEIVIDDSFDEKEFILGDMYGTKVLVGVFIFAIISGIVFATLQVKVLPTDNKIGMWICLALCALCMYLMKPLFRKLGFHIDMLENKTMIGNYIMYLLLTLGVWILCLNPPFFH